MRRGARELSEIRLAMFAPTTECFEAHLVEFSRTPALPQAHLVEFSRTPALPQAHLVEFSRTPELTQAHLVEFSRTPELTQAHLVEFSRTPELTQAHLVESSRTPALPEAHLAESSSTPELPKARLAEVSSTPELPKARLAEFSRIPELSETRLAASPRTRELHRNCLAEFPCIPECLQNCLAEVQCPPVAPGSWLAMPSGPPGYDCLDAAASEIPCSGTGHATMPWISVFGEGMGRILEAPQMNDFKARKMNDVTITPGVPKALSPDATFFFIMPEVEIGRKDDGWYYRSLGGSSGYNRNLPKIGHFPTSREAARAAVADLALVDGDWINNLLLVVETSSMVGRAMAELIIAVCEDNPARAQVVQDLTAALAAAP